MSDPVDLIVKETQLCRRVKLGLQTLHCVTEFVCEVSLLYIFLTTLRSAVLTDERSLCLSLSLSLSFYFCIFHVVVFGPGAISLKRATLKEPPYAAERSVGVMREMVVLAAKPCSLRDGQRCRLRYKHSCCSFNEPCLTTSRCIRGSDMMSYWRLQIILISPSSTTHTHTLYE